MSSTEPDIFTKYPSLKKMQGMDEEDIVESHDGREVTLLKYIYSHPKLDSHLRGCPSAILAAMDEFAAQEDFLINVGSDKAGKLAVLIREHRPRVVLELGGYVGYVVHTTIINIRRTLTRLYSRPLGTRPSYSQASSETFTSKRERTEKKRIRAGLLR